MSRRNQPSNGQRIVAGLLVLTQFFWLPPSLAATYYWDADANPTNNVLPSTGLGGTGTWNATTANWWDGSSVTSTIWANSSANVAAFAGTGGVVTLGAAITAGGLTFDSDGYTI
ncbi:MAG TPA: hypothetical protein VD994_15505, partial [Prosthecobacter sp.]|nr:hypothetical protein [Prosthecobacter sp.]